MTKIQLKYHKTVPFRIFKDTKAKWRWTCTSQNGRKLAVSSESYSRRIDALRGAKATLDVLMNDDAVFDAKVL